MITADKANGIALKGLIKKQKREMREIDKEIKNCAKHGRGRADITLYDLNYDFVKERLEKKGFAVEERDYKVYGYDMVVSW